MTKATDISICILMGSSLIILILEAISNRQIRMGLVEKPHIRLLAIGSLGIALLLMMLDSYHNAQISRRPFLFINDIASIFLALNTGISLLMGHNTLGKSKNIEIYFLILASLAISINNVCTTSLLIKLISSTSWLVVMTTIAIRSTQGGKKAEMGLKMGFTIKFIVLQFLFCIFILWFSGYPLDLDHIVLSTNNNFKTAFIGMIVLALAGITLSGAPPFHFGHVDCADGANSGVAFLFLSNATIQGCSLLLSIKNVLIKSGLNIEDESNFFSIMLIFGFMILCLRSLDQSKIRRTTAYIATTIGPLFSMSILFGTSVLLPKLIYILALYIFLTLALFTLYGSLSYMDPINLPWQTWEDMSGFGRSRPLPTLTFLIAIASIAGLPGTLGYFVKLSLIAPLHESIIFSGAIFLSIAIGAACVMRVFVFMFSKQRPIRHGEPLASSPPFILVFASIVLIVLGFFPFVR